MELREFIGIGAKKAGSLTELGRMLGQDQRHMSNAKAHSRPLPLDAAVRLADYIGADLRAVIAANELVTEKKEEKREFWRPFAEHAKAASYALIFVTVTSFVTPTPANAAIESNYQEDSLYYVKLAMIIAWLKQLQAHQSKSLLRGAFQTDFA